MEKLNKSPGPSLLSCEVLSALCLGSGAQNLPLSAVSELLVMSHPSLAAALNNLLLFIGVIVCGKIVGREIEMVLSLGSLDFDILQLC